MNKIKIVEAMRLITTAVEMDDMVLANKMLKILSSAISENKIQKKILTEIELSDETDALCFQKELVFNNKSSI